MRPCLAATESATVMLFLTALAPGIVELAKMLSLSLRERRVLIRRVILAVAGGEGKGEDGASDCNSALRH